MDDILQEEILHHYKNPQNYGVLKNADNIITETNASCGDSCTFYLKLTSNKSKVKDITFTGTGCSISQASSSLLTTYIKENPVIKKLPPFNKKFMEKLIGAKINPGRSKCLMISAKAAQSSLIGSQKT